MAFELAAWAVIVLAVYPVGRGALALLRADDLRVGDRFVLSTWLGLVVVAVSLLAVSLFVPLAPAVSVSVGAVLAALGASASRASVARATRGDNAPGSTLPVVAGIAIVAIGAAALASDPVTLYDSLVYHVGAIRWLRENGTVPGVALVHNRLGHVSAWFTIAAVFDTGAMRNRAANVSLGFVLLMVGIQATVALRRIVAKRALVADWFLLLTSVALIWAAAGRGAATPSPDVGANVLLVVAAWSLLLVPAATSPFRARLVPFAIALGACSMKLFAIPAVVATLSYALLAPTHELAGQAYVRRAAVCAALGVLLVGPLIAANLVASGCPAYPSPLACLDAPWSVGASQASDYAGYVRDVARWERRGETSAGASLGWIVPWIIAHPVLALLAVLSPLLAVSRLPRETTEPSRDRIRAVVGFALLGILFVGWQAPAPRFLYVFVLVVPVLALAVALHSRPASRVTLSPTDATRRVAVAFVVASVAIGFSYALASQKLNVRSALVMGARFMPVTRTELLVPSAPEMPTRLFRWRVNDVDVLTPVPTPIADTLDYHSVIAFNASFEKCSTAPLPCTPYLPAGGIRLRSPSKGLIGGFVRAERPDFAGRMASCVGELSLAPPADPPTLKPTRSDHTRCGDDQR